MSLRTRLVAGLLLVAAAGLVLLAAITYAEQRSFLQDRVDEQVRAAPTFADRLLDAQGISVPGYGGGGFGPFGPGKGRGFGPGGGGPPGAGPVNLPSGTYAERRDAKGRVLGGGVSGYTDASDVVAPDLPADLPEGELVTVPAQGDRGVRFRALATAAPDQPGTVVVAVPLSENDRTLDRLRLVLAIVVVGVLVVLGVAGWFVVRVGLRPLDRIGATAGAIAAGDLSRRVAPAEPRTEVGRLGLALNAMLERLEAAFAQREASEQRLRQFIADASHELRTPLASIRGYAELFRMGAARDAADTEKAMSRIEDEAARMGVLVEDLLTLARLDEVRDAERAPVDLAVLAEDAAHDARAVDPTRPVEVADEGAAIVLGDEHQLRQVLANLLRNAVVHTPPGTRVEVGVRGGDETVELRVRDHGPGLPTDDADALFERFWRAQGERGRERGPAGAGLGLAIVAGIVQAHGGTVRAGNATDGGAVFTITLPAHPAGV
ncbi:cell wall metabolism sensor histidine kinase WalK [Conexibacter sp. SYSU D00693]|uniref:sensor histidine kinase n=1 Tax=Conexibacter sp. SYSU D00693 TaxID=2812560 RepID=UPI00196AD9E2|nr:HAMP domain-containing sensor histidine kinase [Conexibacter sp. SYSU D00693]